MFYSKIMFSFSDRAIQAARRQLPRQAAAEDGGELPSGAARQQPHR